MSWVLRVAAAEPVAAGLILLIAPARLSWLILGAEPSEAGQAIGRLAAIGLVGLGLACWPASGAVTVPIAATRVLLIYNLLEMVLLGFLGAAGTLVGVLLWPAFALHVIMSGFLGRAWLAKSQ